MSEEIQNGAAGIPSAEKSEKTGEVRGRRKERIGTVIAANTANTIKVVVSRRVKHATYAKYVTRRKKYAVHDLQSCQVGDRVRIRETRPLSKTKHWVVVAKVAKDA